MSTNGRVNFTAPSSLTVGGTLEIQSGGRVRLDGSSPARDLTLLPGSTLVGTGTIQLDGSCRLVVPGDFDSTVFLVLNGPSTRLVAPGVYTVRTSRSMNGTVEAAGVVIPEGVELTVS